MSVPFAFLITLLLILVKGWSVWLFLPLYSIIGGAIVGLLSGMTYLLKANGALSQSFTFGSRKVIKTNFYKGRLDSKSE